MRNVVFITSHLLSGSDDMINLMNNHGRIDIRSPRLSYDHPEVLEQLYKYGHKLNNSAAIYGDHLLFNKDFSSREFYKFIKFIYFVCSPRNFLNEILTRVPTITVFSACRYYCFRLRRMYEMALCTPGAVFLTADEFLDGKGTNLIEDYLELPTPLDFSNARIHHSAERPIDYKYVVEANRCFEKYHYCFKHINLLKL